MKFSKFIKLATLNSAIRLYPFDNTHELPCEYGEFLDLYPPVMCICVFLLLADLFDILLPMLNIYQEFVRNHQYSLQVLANCKQNRDFDKLLKQYESNAACEGRMLETFLTYPMFQVDHGHLHTPDAITKAVDVFFFFYQLLPQSITST